MRLLVCVNYRLGSNPSCGARGSQVVAAALEQAVRERGLVVQIVRSPCLGCCQCGPNVKPEGHAVRKGVTIKAIPAFLDELNANGNLSEQGEIR
ncbi:MAG: (2Fe-2S) ferredoxin domain-containing protein [Rhodospirillales bacterium]|nr:(2Fe-2S) ferredoxin domain-containing protein [Rhodospirillales bacterium]